MTSHLISRHTCTVSMAGPIKGLFGALVVALLAGCSTSKYVEVDMGGQKVIYVLQSCTPAVKWDGMSVSLEGLSVPKGGNTAFSIGKINYEEKSLREIKESVTYYDGLLNATCQTLVRLTSESSIKEYSLHRDQLLKDFIQMLSTLQQAGSESAATTAAEAGKKTAEKSETVFQASQKQS